ncbi:MAG: hypothetical protein KTR14_00690 [Vampirovibrio sp.]|nr:hypothetical protein [Vampirovibrio sp.]
MASLKGQGLSEYSIIGGTVALISMIGIGVMADGFSTLMADMTSKAVNSPQQAQTITLQATPNSPASPATTIAQGAPATNNNTPAVATASGNGMSVTLSNGTNLVIPSFTTDYSTLVETAGAAGATQTLVANLDQVIAGLETNGEITSADANLLKALAQKGHEIADLEAFFEDLGANETNSDYLYQPITYQGKTYNEAFLLLQTKIGFSSDLGPDRVGIDPLNTQALGVNGSPQEMNQEFIILYHQAKNRGALSSPAAKAIVTELSNQILFTTEIFEHSVALIREDKVPPQNLNSFAYSHTTSYQSQGICQTGGSISCH